MDIRCGHVNALAAAPESSTTTQEPETTTLPTTTLQSTVIAIKGTSQTGSSQSSMKPTGMQPIFGSTNYEVTDYDMNEKKAKDKHSGENSIVKPTVSDDKMGNDINNFDSMDEQLDLLLTKDFLETKVTNNNYASNLGGQLTGLESMEDVTTGKTEPELNEVNMYYFMLSLLKINVQT